MIVYLMFELILIVAYLYENVLVGIIAWLFIMYWNKKESISSVDFWIRLIISAIPISYLEITCEIGLHIFKWYNFAILGLVLSLIRPRMKFSRKSVLVLIVALSAQLVRTFFLKDLGTAVTELFQEYLFIIPAFLIWSYLREKKASISEEINVENWIELFKNTSFVSAVGVLIQYSLYMLTGVKIGYVTIWNNRQVFDLTFTGYSVLSVFLGLGIVLSVKDILEKKNTFSNVIILIVCGGACVVNSSRSGFFSSIVIIAIMLITALVNSKKGVRALIFSIPIAIVMVVALGLFIQARSSMQGGNLLFANGRDIIVEEAFMFMENNWINLLFGIGISGVSENGLNSQHNMFLEFWVLNGIPLFLVFVFVIALIIWKTRKTESKYMLWQILLAHQFFSSFFATTFTLPVLCIIAGEYYSRKNKIL